MTRSTHLSSATSTKGPAASPRFFVGQGGGDPHDKPDPLRDDTGGSEGQDGGDQTTKADPMRKVKPSDTSGATGGGGQTTKVGPRSA